MIAATAPPQWTRGEMLAAPLELLAVAWLIPVAILAFGAPIALGVKLLVYLGGLL
jgi:hypothetical protein